jgi:very-short-patch-repair endonuclease
MTPEEAVLWRALRRNQLDGLHFRRQQVIDRFVVDFYCHAARLIVEVDGAGHQSQGAYDADRDRILSSYGVQVLRVTNHEIRDDLHSILDRIATLAKSRVSKRPFPHREGAGG